jgi:hypothetical protein
MIAKERESRHHRTSEEVKMKKRTRAPVSERIEWCKKWVCDKNVKTVYANAGERRLGAVHVALHHLDLVLAIAFDYTAANVPAQLEVVALGCEHLGVGRAGGVFGEVWDFHGRGRFPVASVDALVESAAMHAESLLLDCGTLCGRGRGAVAAGAEGLAAAFAGVAVDGVAADILLDFAVGAAGPLAVDGLLGCALLVITFLRAISALGVLGVLRAVSTLGVVGVLRAVSTLGVVGVVRTVIALRVLGIIRAVVLFGRSRGSRCSLIFFRCLGLSRCRGRLRLSPVWLRRRLGGRSRLRWFGGLRWASSDTADIDLGAVHKCLMLAVEPDPGEQSVALGHVGRYLEVEGLSLRWAILSVQWASTVVGCGELPGFTLVYRETNLARASVVSSARSFRVVCVVGELEVGILSSLPCHRSIFGVELVEVTTAETRARPTRTAIGTTASERKVELLVDRGGLLVDRRGCT